MIFTVKQFKNEKVKLTQIAVAAAMNVEKWR